MRPSRSTKVGSTPMQSHAEINPVSQAGTSTKPSIRLTSATRSVPPDSSTTFDQSWNTLSSQIPAPLAPKANEPSRRKLVPKKSKLSILGMGRDKEKDRGKDLSDVVRRVGAGNSASVRGGFEIYVDPTEDPDIGEIVMVKKKKSRAALDGMSWGALGEVTNVPKLTQQAPTVKFEENPTLLKLKTGEDKKWWSISRGRKISKGKDKEDDTAQAIEIVPNPRPRSKTPEPFESTQDSRARFNSLDTKLLFGKAKNASVRATRASTSALEILRTEPEEQPSPPRERARSTTPAATMFRSMTPTFGGLLMTSSVPAPDIPSEEKQGSIAVRALKSFKSMRSIARIGSWAQLKSMPPPSAQEMAEEMVRAESEADNEKAKERKKKKKAPKESDQENVGSVREKKKERKEKKLDESGSDVRKKKSTKQDKSARKPCSSTSSFEAGALSECPEASKTLGSRKHSILGLGLPSSMRVPKMRSGSTASSINFKAPSSAQANPSAPPSSAGISMNPNVTFANLAHQTNRRSVDSDLPQGHSRSGSVVSSGSSLRPASFASTTSRISSGSSIVSRTSGSSGGSSVSVRWDEQGLETVREQRRREREARRSSDHGDHLPRTSKESTRKSADARKRLPLSGVFEEVHPYQVGVAMSKDLTDVVEEESRIGTKVDVSLGSSLRLGKNVKRLSTGSGNSARTTSTSSSLRRRRPILTIEEATADGHEFVDEELDEDDSGRDEGDNEDTDHSTPVKKTRRRPISQELLGKEKPKPLHEEDKAVISILSAATQDLAHLLTTLDLQATPGTDVTPNRSSPPATIDKEEDLFGSNLPSPCSYDGSPKSKSTQARVALGQDSPLKKTSKGPPSSLVSLRPYAQSRKNSLTNAANTPLPSTLKPKLTTASKGSTCLIGQPISPWSDLLQSVSPAKSKMSSSASTIRRVGHPNASQAFKSGHKRSMTPAPEPEPEPVFQPLMPSRSRTPTTSKSARNVMATIRPVKSKVGLAIDVFNKGSSGSETEKELDSSLFSARTFGPRSASLSKSSIGSVILDDASSKGPLHRTPVFKRVQEIEDRERERSISQTQRSNGGTVKKSNTHRRLPLEPATTLDETNSQPRSSTFARGTRKLLGMSGTLGGSDVSLFDGLSSDDDDHDSDVPDELKTILGGNASRVSVVNSITSQSDYAVYSQNPRPISLPPAMPPPPVPTTRPPTIEIPVFQPALLNVGHTYLGIDCGDEDTKRSFDFTGEIRRLNECGGCDNASFVAELEKAFQTPAKVDLRSNFNDHLRSDIPAVPALPLEFRRDTSNDLSASSSTLDYLGESEHRLLDVSEPSMPEIEDDRLSDESISPLDLVSDGDIMKEPFVRHRLPGDEEDIAMESPSEESAFEPRHVHFAGSRSNGELDRSFRFGGLPQHHPSLTSLIDEEQPLTLSDIIPPPAQARAIAEMSMLSEDLEDESVLESIYAKLVVNGTSDDTDDCIPHSLTSSQYNGPLFNRQSIYRESSRPTSGISFAGLESFDDVRRGFEFGGDRSFYPPAEPRNGRKTPHLRDQSLMSIASVSSYGHAVNSGKVDPFDYGMRSSAERPLSEDMSVISMSMVVEDTFEFIRNKPRRRVESDASSFYIHGPRSGTRNRYRDSIMSVVSQGPPVSLYTRGQRRRRDSNASVNSIRAPRSRYSTNINSSWAHHTRTRSTDSMMSDFSIRHVDRPGLGDKMFDNAMDSGRFASVVSPPDNSGESDSRYPTSFDSIMDDDPKSSSVDDSLFDKTGHRTSVIMSNSIFGDDGFHQRQSSLLPANHFRPLSQYSFNNEQSVLKEDDTMISMLGGGHVRRRSIGSIMEASPCVRVGKRKHSAIHQGAKLYKNVEEYESPNKARIVEKPSRVSSTSFDYGRQTGYHALVERESVEEICLVAEGEDTSGYCMPLFPRPVPTRSRSSTCTSSSGANTPPLSMSISDTSSVSEGSQSSIDLSQINIALATRSQPVHARNRSRARARGAGHRRRYSKAQKIRSSVYETIEEEAFNPGSPSQVHKDNSSNRHAVYVVDSDTASLGASSEDPIWDEENGIVALRKFYALRDEVETTVSESRRVWRDTPVSIFAVQSFDPPHHPAGMQALLEQSVQNYGPLPSELRVRRVRSRTSSRPSPYPQSRVPKFAISSDSDVQPTAKPQTPSAIPVLRQLKAVDLNSTVAKSVSSKSTLPATKVDGAPSKANIDKFLGTQGAAVRPRVASSDRRAAPGWAKRNGLKSSTQKENLGSGKENNLPTATMTTPGDTLRLSRPRPKARTPGGRIPTNQSRPIRI